MPLNSLHFRQNEFVPRNKVIIRFSRSVFFNMTHVPFHVSFFINSYFFTSHRTLIILPNTQQSAKEREKRRKVRRYGTLKKQSKEIKHEFQTHGHKCHAKPLISKLWWALIQNKKVLKKTYPLKKKHNYMDPMVVT